MILNLRMFLLQSTVRAYAGC